MLPDVEQGGWIVNRDGHRRAIRSVASMSDSMLSHRAPGDR